jgi:hypothetical protein
VAETYELKSKSKAIFGYIKMILATLKKDSGYKYGEPCLLKGRLSGPSHIVCSNPCDVSTTAMNAETLEGLQQTMQLVPESLSCTLE